MKILISAIVNNSNPLQVLLVTLLVQVALLSGNLVSQAVVLAGQTLALLLESLNVTVLGLDDLLETADLADGASLSDAGGVLATGLLIAVEKTNAVLETEDLKDHGVGAVENEREEESESTKVHVALRVELTGLDLHAVGTKVGGARLIISCSPRFNWLHSLPHAGTFLGEGGKLLLDTVDAVHRVNEEDKNEDECDLKVK